MRLDVKNWVSIIAAIVGLLSPPTTWLVGRSYAQESALALLDARAVRTDADVAELQALRADVAELTTGVRVLLDRMDRRRTPPGGPGSEPPPAVPPPSTEQVQRDVQEILRRLDRIERDCAATKVGCPAPPPEQGAAEEAP